MDLRIQTSTPIIYEKLIPPPPRKLWATDSVAEQLYRNRWTKYRNSMEEKESWSVLEAPRFVDFADIPEARDSYFDNAEEEKFATPQRTLARRLPGSNSDNNNIFASLSKCSLSAIKKNDENKRENENQLLLRSSAVADPIDEPSRSFDDSSDSTIKTNDQDKMDFDAPKPPDDLPSEINAEEERSGSSKVERKNRSDNSNSNRTIVEPFSFESRERCKQAHRQARRERDSIGKETWKGFRANPVPNFLKFRQKNRLPATTRAETKKTISNVDTQKLNAAEIWKRKAFEPSHPKRVPIVTKAPQLLTAVRARERQRFEEQAREKERQREAVKKIEEAARKKREEEEIAKLRRELVHKAQPIRKYKIIVPRVEKRPLTEPMTPITCKRRRKI